MFTSIINAVRKTEARMQHLDAILSSMGNKSEQAINRLQVDAHFRESKISAAYGEISFTGHVMWCGNFQYKLDDNSSGSLQITDLLSLSVGKSLIPSTPPDITSNIYCDIAIGVCEGEIDEMISVSINDKIIKPRDFKCSLYKGIEAQTPNFAIQKDLGSKTPAFQNLCYLVIEGFPISNYGNNIPQFSFHARKSKIINKQSDQVTKQAQGLITSVNIIPGSGEFVYDTQIQTKYACTRVDGELYKNRNLGAENCHNNEGVADAVLALDKMKIELPNLKHVSVVVSWFADSVDIATCSIYPAVEYKSTDTEIFPDQWNVAGQTRETAKLISRDANGNPLYGGTTNDASLVRYLNELKARGYKVTLYPMLFMDDISKPWRGRITGDIDRIEGFFSKPSGYNQFILHYAELAKNIVDAFVIGSELVGLTKLHAGSGVFPAVNALSNLANQVRKTLDPNITITYAADWSEYHHTEGGWYNMDVLWANPNIDYIGIDAYFPLTNITNDDATKSRPSIEEIRNGWTSGEGYDFVYNADRTIKSAIQPEWAWKNLRYFVDNCHINPDGTKTPWQPKMKKIRFIEYGFPSVDLCTNEPNVFYDPHSSESGFPKFSNEKRDFLAQKKAIIATELFCSENRDVIEQEFLWAYDARPYPYFPSLKNAWHDRSAWEYGHWINGKITSVTLASIVSDLCLRARLSESEIDTSDLSGTIDGVVFNSESVASALNILKTVYCFESYQAGNSLKFISLKSANFMLLSLENILIIDSKAAQDNRAQSFQETVSCSDITSIKLFFLDPDDNYRRNYIIANLDTLASIKQSIEGGDALEPLFLPPSPCSDSVEIPGPSGSAPYPNHVIQDSRRPIAKTSDAGKRIQVSVPVALSKTDATTVALRLLSKLHGINGNTIELKFTIHSTQYAQTIAPCDIISFARNGARKYLQMPHSDRKFIVISVKSATFGMIEITARELSSQELYLMKNKLEPIKNIESATGSSIQIAPTSNQAKLSIFEIPNIKSDIPSQTTVTLHFACPNLIESTQNSTPTFGQIYFSENGTDYKKLLNITQNGIIGNVSNFIGAPFWASNPFLFIDESASFEVILQNQTAELRSMSDESFLLNQNLALVGDEIICFKNVLQISEYRYKISHLLRGRFNTHNRVQNHPNGAEFVMLSKNIYKADLSIALVFSDVYFKCVRHGEQIQNVSPIKFVPQIKSIEPFEILQKYCHKLPDKSLLLSWYPRTNYSRSRLFGEPKLINSPQKFEISATSPQGDIVKLGTSDNANFLLSLQNQIAIFAKPISSLAYTVNLI